MRLKRTIRALALRMSMSNFLPNSLRLKLVRWGVKCGKSFIGQQVIFDSEHPENIEIGDFCAITMRCILLTHYVVPRGSYHDYEYGKIKIGNNVFLGANTVITKSVTIGDNVIVGAGSIVTKDIPSNEIWAGVPARFIKSIIKENKFIK